MAGTFGITEFHQGLGEPVANIGEIIGGLIAVPQDQRIVLIGFQQLLAPSFAAHHKQATVLHEVFGGNQCPCAFKQTGIQLLNQLGNQIDARAPAIENRNHAGDFAGGHGQSGQIGGGFNLQRDQMRVVGQEAEQIKRFQHADHFVLIRHHHTMHAIAQHLRQCIAHLCIGTDGHQRKIGKLFDGQLIKRPAREDRALQSGCGKNTQGRRGDAVIAHQHIRGALRIENFDDAENVGLGRHKMGWS